MNFRTLIASMGNGADVVIPLESIRATSEQLLIHLLVYFWENGWLTPLLLTKSETLGNPNVNLQKQDVGNVPVWVKFHGVHMTAFSEYGLSVIATKIGTPLMLDSYTSHMCMQSWGRSSYARAIIELRADDELKDTIVVAMSKLIDECPKKIILDVVKNLKSPRQATRGDVGFKSTKQIYRPVSNNNSSSTRCKKSKLKCLDKRKLLLVDDDEKSLPKVVSIVNADSDSEVEEVFDEHARFMASIGLERSSNSGYDTNSLLEQWMETKRDDGYEPYDDDLYEGHDTYDNIKAICDDLISPSMVERRNRFIFMFFGSIVI
ncbi:putative reverse transcriptase domain-containing protein [Tanacetum coccineum]